MPIFSRAINNDASIESFSIYLIPFHQRIYLGFVNFLLLIYVYLNVSLVSWEKS